MRVKWSEAKRLSKFRKHDLGFMDAITALEGAVIAFEDDWFNYSEDRFVSIGLLQSNLVVIAHSESDDEVRVISMRKATSNERRVYFGEFADELGSPE